MKKSPHQLREKSDDKLRIDFHEPKTYENIAGDTNTQIRRNLNLTA